MTVKELIEKLQKHPPELEVVKEEDIGYDGHYVGSLSYVYACLEDIRYTKNDAGVTVETKVIKIC
ncbi:MAG: hypothetical protein HOP31_15015 [Ignavibacteria bacterium]|nr:hypothetical protein [Ignavibacteria bacterium]